MTEVSRTEKKETPKATEREKLLARIEMAAKRGDPEASRIWNEIIANDARRVSTSSLNAALGPVRRKHDK